jgi:hypothetical protein
MVPITYGVIYLLRGNRWISACNLATHLGKNDLIYHRKNDLSR